MTACFPRSRSVGRGKFFFAHTALDVLNRAVLFHFRQDAKNRLPLAELPHDMLKSTFSRSVMEY